MRIIFLFIFILISTDVNASSPQLTTIGQHNKSIMLETVSPDQKHKFPALYIYDTEQQQFLSKQDAAAYLQTLDASPLLPELASQWTKSTEQFSTNNNALAKSLPMLQLDRTYLILYDNLPAPMLTQLKSMDPELERKDALLRKVLSQLTSARSYTTY